MTLKEYCRKNKEVEKLKRKYNWYYAHNDLTKGQKKMIEQKQRWANK